MATVVRPIYVKLGSGTGNNTLVAGSRGIEAFDWQDLLTSAPKRGENRVIAGISGTEVRARVRHELRAAIQLRLYGEWTQNNVPVAGDTARMQQMYTHLEAVRVVTEKTGVQPLELITPWKTYGPKNCQVESGGTPRFLNPYTCELTLDLTIPSGSLL